MKCELAFDNLGFEEVTEHPSPLNSPVNTVTIKILGMTCQSCVQSIEGRISKVKGIVSIKVSLKQSNAVIKYLELEINPHQICQEIEDMGFDASIVEAMQSLGQWTSEALVKIRIEGMTCQSCVNTIEGKIGKLHGVKRIRVALNTQEATIAYFPYVIKPEELKNNIDSLGYESTIKHKPAPLKLGLIDTERLQQVSVGMPDDGGGASLENKVNETSVVVLGVEGMHCKSCINTIERAVSDLPGVHLIQVSMEQKNAVVWFNQNLITPSSLQQAIQDLPPGNFKVPFYNDVHDAYIPSSLPCFPISSPQVQLPSKLSTTVISIGGMTCNSCVKSIESSVSQRKGVVCISVSLAEGTATISYDAMVTNSDELRTAIEDTGFDASVLTGTFSMLSYE